MSDTIDPHKIAADRLKRELEKPLQEDADVKTGDDFDPWDAIGGYVMGSYNSEFDDVALTVLRNIRDKGHVREESVAHEVFREMLCVAGLCDYGTSPCVCFMTHHAEPLLDELIDKWESYKEINWSN